MRSICIEFGKLSMKHTPQKANMEIENHAIEEENHLQTINF